MELVKACVKPKHFVTFQKAVARSDELVAKGKEALKIFFADKPEIRDKICFAVVGSAGRREALDASDFDFIPVAADRKTLEEYCPFDMAVREALSKSLEVSVSKGENLTKATCIQELTKPSSIGGSDDSSNQLTKRVLLLTESAQVFGGYEIRSLRASLLKTYAQEERTSGRHILSLCNDIARYYKTLCIEYKGKIDHEGKKWPTRNMKLRHSRKIWYFSNILAITMLAGDHPHGDAKFSDSLLDAFAMPPIVRLAKFLREDYPLALSRLLENYALFLEFMSNIENRAALDNVEHKARYDMILGNPFPMMKFNSDLIHGEVISIIEELGPSTRARIMSWFLL